MQKRRYDALIHHGNEVSLELKQNEKKLRLSPLMPNHILACLDADNWYGAYIRCLGHPYECNPIIDSNCERVVHDTPLGIACRKFSNTTIFFNSNGFPISVPQHEIIKTLYYASPMQLKCKQGVAGRTPLVDVLCNQESNFHMAKFFIDADCSTSMPMALLSVDSDGLSPIHHLISQIHKKRATAREKEALKIIQYIVDKCPSTLKNEVDMEKKTQNISPLIHLLSQNQGSSKTTENHELHTAPIVQCAEFLLSRNKKLILSKSTMTSCTPIHMALRNGFGHNHTLVKLLLENDPDGIQVQTKNSFGDHPLHVAATVGIPIKSLQILLEHILLTTTVVTSLDNTPGCDIQQPNTLLWSRNRFNLTPVHLMWMRRVHGFRPYPMSYTKCLNLTQRLSFYYDGLSGAIKEISSSLDDNSSTTTIEKAALDVLGPFWDNIVIMFKSIHSSLTGDSAPLTQSNCLFLHAACALLGTSLPRPFIDLALLIYSNNISKADTKGRGALHYACASYPVKVEHKLESQYAHGWRERNCTSNGSEGHVEDESTFRQLIQLCPLASTLYDKNKFLPLHYAIESEKKWRAAEESKLSSDDTEVERKGLGERRINWTTEVRRMALDYPEAMDQSNAQGLFPFMQAAIGPGASLQSIYFFLRMAPGITSTMKK